MKQGPARLLPRPSVLPARHGSAAFVLAAMLHAMASAQTVAPSQVTPPSLRPEPPRAAPPLAAPAAAEPRTASADDALDVQLGDVLVEGGRAELADATRALQAALAGRRVTLGAIREQVRLLEQAYAERGWFLVRVALPPQRLADGAALRVAVIDGFVEAIDASGVPERVRAVVERTLAPLVGQRGLTLDEAERRLLLAGSSAGLALRSTLVPGEAPGATRLVLDGRHRIAGAGLRLGNTLPRALGTLDAQATLTLNGAFGAGERLYLALGSGRSLFDTDSTHGHLRLVAAGAVLPLGADGWQLNPEFTASATRPAPEPGALRTRGSLERSALRLVRAALATSQGIGWGGQIAFEHVRQRQQAVDFGVDLSEDCYRVLRLGAEAAGPMAGAALTYSRGLGGRDAAAARAEGVALSRSAATPRFDRLAGSARAAWALSGGFGLGIVALGQGSFGAPLLTSEQFALGGPDAVSALTPGALPVDQGATLRAQLSAPATPVSFGERGSATPYLFAATGRGHVFEPTAAERASVHASAAGLGLRWAAGSAFGLQLEAARRFGDADADARRWRAHVTLSLGL